MWKKSVLTSTNIKLHESFVTILHQSMLRNSQSLSKKKNFQTTNQCRTADPVTWWSRERWPASPIPLWRGQWRHRDRTWCCPWWIWRTARAPGLPLSPENVYIFLLIFFWLILAVINKNVLYKKFIGFFVWTRETKVCSNKKYEATFHTDIVNCICLITFDSNKLNKLFGLFVCNKTSKLLWTLCVQFVDLNFLTNIFCKNIQKTLLRLI